MNHLGEEGYLAITDLGLDKRDFPVYLEFAAGDQLLGRAEVASEVQFALQELCNQYEIGISVDQVVLQDVNPPDPVKPSFNEVNEAQTWLMAGGAVQEKEKKDQGCDDKDNDGRQIQQGPRAQGSDFGDPSGRRA